MKCQTWDYDASRVPQPAAGELPYRHGKNPLGGTGCLAIHPDAWPTLVNDQCN